MTEALIMQGDKEMFLTRFDRLSDKFTSFTYSPHMRQAKRFPNREAAVAFLAEHRTTRETFRIAEITTV